MVDPLPSSRVPPQARAYGLEAGRSTCALRSLIPSDEPLSPEATVTVTPSSAASRRALFIAFFSEVRQLLSGPPQLMEMTEGLFTESWAASVIAWMNPCVVLGAK